MLGDGRWACRTRVVLLLSAWRAASLDLALSQDQQPLPRIGIVSERYFHLEVAAGLVGTLAPKYGSNMTVYLHSFNMRHRIMDYGFLDLLKVSERL